MGLVIRLLGVPRVERHGVALGAPKGRKTWALFAYLLRSEIAPTRQAMAGILFPDADDPMGALRWTLSELRRFLGAPGVVAGHPLEVRLPEGTVVDLDLLAGPPAPEAVEVVRRSGPFLEGLTFPGAPAFELWLENERRYLEAASAGLLGEAARQRLARDDVEGALQLASRLVESQPLDENAHVLFTRCLVAARRTGDARAHVRRCTELFRRELGVDPSPALRGALEAGPRPAGSPSRPGVVAQLEAGEAAFSAGAVAAGIQILQQAAADAEATGDVPLVVRALLALGSALVHSARGGDEEGAGVLHLVIAAAEKVGDVGSAATAHRELGYVAFLRGEYERAETRLARAAELASEAGAEEEMAWVGAIEGGARSDVGDYALALAALKEAVDRAGALGAARCEASALALLGRLHLLRDDLAEAGHHLERSLQIGKGLGWNGFLPWPEALLADVALRGGALDAAHAGFERSFAMGCQLGDPCWESIAARGLGLVRVASGDLKGGLEMLAEAPGRCRRLPDSYRWIEAYALEPSPPSPSPTTSPPPGGRSPSSKPSRHASGPASWSPPRPSIGLGSATTVPRRRPGPSPPPSTTRPFVGGCSPHDDEADVISGPEHPALDRAENSFSRSMMAKARSGSN